MNTPIREMVEQRVAQVIAERLEIREDSVVLGANLRIDLGANDQDILEIVWSLENEFNLNLPRDEDEIPTVQGLIDYIYSQSESSQIHEIRQI